MLRIVIVVQARMLSTRLPGKVLMPLHGRPLLLRMMERLARVTLADHLVVATTEDAADDPIAALCAEAGLDCFRGHPTDLLDRHYQAGRTRAADAVVKIPSDCPLIDPAVVDRVLGFYREAPGRWDFLSNLHPPSYPDGNDVEVMPLPLLERAWREAVRPLEREHTTPFFWDQPERFRIGNVSWESGRDLSRSHRWTIDYIEDYRLIAAVYDALMPVEPAFGLDAILALLDRRPDIAALNAGYAGSNWYRQHLHELATKTADDTRL